MTNNNGASEFLKIDKGVAVLRVKPCKECGETANWLIMSHQHSVNVYCGNCGTVPAHEYQPRLLNIPAQ